MICITWLCLCYVVVAKLCPTPGIAVRQASLFFTVPVVCSNSCRLSWWCHPTISSSVAPSPPALTLSSIRVFSSVSALHVRWLKYWSFSFSINPSNEYSGLISFRIDWINLAVHGTVKSLLQHHSEELQQALNLAASVQKPMS